MSVPVFLQRRLGYFLRVLALFILIVWFGNASHAQVILKEGQTEIKLGKEALYWEDFSDSLSIEQILRTQLSRQFKAFPSSDANFGFKHNAHWVTFTAMNKAPLHNNHWLLEVGYSAYAEIDLYVVGQNGKIVFHQQGGDWRGTKSRPISFHNFVFNLPLDTDAPYSVFLRLKPLAGQVIIPITVWETKAFINYAILYQLFWGIYFGMLLIVFLYHTVVYCFNWRQKEYNGYLYLSIYLLTYLLFELTRGGCIGVRYLWPNASWWVNYGFVTSFFSMMLMFILFYSVILEIPQKMKKLFVVLQGLCITALLALFVIDMGWWNVSKNAASFGFGGVSGFLLMVAAFQSWRTEKGNQSTGFYYMIAAFTLYTGGIVMLLHRMGVIRGSHFFTLNALNLGSIIEFIALSIGLALRIQWQRRENGRLTAEKKRTVLDTKQKEVKRMTSAIHDYFGSQIVYLQERVESLYRDYIDTLNQKRMEEVFRLIEEILEGIRLLAHYYMPYKLSEKGLRATLEELVWRYNELKKVGFVAHFSGTEQGLSHEIQDELYYVVIELFTNILKHAHATTAALITYDEGDRYCLQVKDDGVGLTENKQRGRGLENIRERVTNIGGELQIVSEPERGTAFLIKIPFLN